MKNNKNLKDDKNEKQRLEAALEINRPLSIAYYLKEELKELWHQNKEEECINFMGEWIAEAMYSGIHQLVKISDMLIRHCYGIFNWYNHKISSGKLEGLNNKIKVVKRMAYGYRDKEFFKLKILSIHKAKYTLVG